MYSEMPFFIQIASDVYSKTAFAIHISTVVYSETPFPLKELVEFYGISFPGCDFISLKN